MTRSVSESGEIVQLHPFTPGLLVFYRLLSFNFERTSSTTGTPVEGCNARHPDRQLVLSEDIAQQPEAASATFATPGSPLRLQIRRQLTPGHFVERAQVLSRDESTFNAAKRAASRPCSTLYCLPAGLQTRFSR